MKRVHRHLAAATLGLACALDGPAGPIEEATYEKCFDRASALLPGRTVIEQDLKQAGAWATAGGRQVDAPDGVAIAVQADTVECVWKGDFPPAPKQPVELELTIAADVATRVMFQVLTDDRFNRVGDWVPVKADSREKISTIIFAPPRRRYGDPGRGQFGGFKLTIAGKDLPGRTIRLKNIKLKAAFSEGFFRQSVAIPAGAIWEAVAEVGAPVTLYVNGARVDDETVILPRPSLRNASLSRRVPLKAHLKPGRNVLAMHVRSRKGSAAAYLRGSVVMASGERILLDSGTNWVWSRTAPEGWPAPDYDDSAWQEPVDIESTPREMGRGYDYQGPAAVSGPAIGMDIKYRPRGDRPCYDGAIQLRNPADNKFYFTEDTPFRLEILIPPGFKDSRPEFAWEISRYARDGTFTPVAEGRTPDFKTAGDSLAASINSGKLEQGIYVFTGRLLVKGGVLEEREPEIMVVTGRLKMPKSAGDTLEQGMDLTLEQTIDFTDPQDPHPWFETDAKGPIPSGRWGTNFYHTLKEPLIVERNGLKYRATRPVARAQFSYQVDFKHPGDWYLLALEYPDDAERWIGVSCNADSRSPAPARGEKPEDLIGAASKCGPAIWTGGKYPNTGKMLEMKWIYRPDPGSHAINVMSLMKDTAAAAARLRILHVQGRLSELDAGDIPLKDQRRFGMLTERTYPWGNGIYNLFSSLNKGEATPQGDRGAGRFSNNVIVDGCEHLRLMGDAAAHFAEYMRFAGQNLHVMGCFQYGDGNTASQYLTGDPRLHDSSINMLARVLQANDLQFFASVQFTATEKMGEEIDPEWFFADRRGDRPVALWANLPRNLNFLHPAVERTMLEVARQLAECFKHQPNFRGINWRASFSDARLAPSYRVNQDDPLALGYDDVTIGMFERDTGIRVPPFAEATGGKPEDGRQKSGVSNQKAETPTENPERFEQRYQFLTSAEMKPAWRAWRSQKMAEFFEKMNRVIRKVRPDLETVAMCSLGLHQRLPVNSIAEWKHQNIPLQDYLDQWGWNPAAFKNQAGVWLMPWLALSAMQRPANRAIEYALGWQGNKDPDFYRAFSGLDRRSLMLITGAVEVERIAANYPYREGWPRPYQQTMMPQQREELALEPYTQAMIGFDPQMVMIGFGDVSPYVGVEGMQRKFARVLRRLPWGRFDPVLNTGFDSNFAIRALRSGRDCLFYVANPGYWPIRGTVTLAGADRVTDLVSGSARPMKDGAIAVALEPFGLAAFKAEGTENLKSEIKVAAWQTAPVADADLAHLRGLLAQAQAAAAKPDLAGFLGEADFGILTNGIAVAERALAERRYAAAWAALTDGLFWTVLFQTIPEMQFADIVKPRAMTSVRVGAEYVPKIDGVLNDRIWGAQESRPVNHFVTQDKEYAKAQTVVRMAHSGNRVFIACEMRDPEPDRIRGTADKENERLIWGAGDDLVAFFIAPGQTNYYQFAVGAGGAKFDQRCGGLRDYDYAPNWQAATGRNKDGWTLEVELDALEAFGVAIRPGLEWKINFHRMFRLQQQPTSSWVYSPDWHSMEHMGTVKFGASNK